MKQWEATLLQKFTRIIKAKFTNLTAEETMNLVINLVTEVSVLVDSNQITITEVK